MDNYHDRIGNGISRFVWHRAATGGEALVFLIEYAALVLVQRNNRCRGSYQSSTGDQIAWANVCDLDGPYVSARFRPPVGFTWLVRPGTNPFYKQAIAWCAGHYRWGDRV